MNALLEDRREGKKKQEAFGLRERKSPAQNRREKRISAKSFNLEEGFRGGGQTECLNDLF